MFFNFIFLGLTIQYTSIFIVIKLILLPIRQLISSVNIADTLHSLIYNFNSELSVLWDVVK